MQQDNIFYANIISRFFFTAVSHFHIQIYFILWWDPIHVLITHIFACLHNAYFHYPLNLSFSLRYVMKACYCEAGIVLPASVRTHAPVCLFVQKLENYSSEIDATCCNVLWSDQIRFTQTHKSLPRLTDTSLHVCSYDHAHDSAQLQYALQQQTVLIIFHLIFQTIITVQTLSSAGDGMTGQV